MTIKELRQMKGLTLAAFAKSIGIGMSTLTGYEAGKRQPGEKALAAIKEVYGVDLNSTAPSATPVEAAAAAPAEEKAVEKKAAKKPRAKKQAAPVETAPVEERAEKSAKKPRAKKQPMPVEAAPIAPAEEKAEKSAKKPRAKKQAAPAKETPTKKPAQIIIQSPMGGEITPEDILTKAGNADKIYVRVDQNKLYIVNGDETSSVDLW
jgi:transcriptional regulator with XRE-family HTH domain